ncbi:MAG: nitroreductase family protein [Bacteroidota bacterium]|nr:nitroreductase family protein [Bacteroidota bacterium]
MTLREILEHRRAVRKYDSTKPLDPEQVKDCISQAILAPTSSNMQLWECYHVTDPETLQELTHACLDQGSARTAQQMVVFVTRRDKHLQHAKPVLQANIDEIHQNSPKDRQEHRIKLQELYYNRVMPLQYMQFFGLKGLLNKILAQTIGIFRPMVRQVTEGEVDTVVHKSCALAVQTFMLAMSEKGYDTCPLEGFDSYRVKKALHLPYRCQINMVITCGIRLPEGVRGDRYRLPLEEYYHRVE